MGDGGLLHLDGRAQALRRRTVPSRRRPRMRTRLGVASALMTRATWRASSALTGVLAWTPCANPICRHAYVHMRACQRRRRTVRPMRATRRSVRARDDRRRRRDTGRPASGRRPGHREDHREDGAAVSTIVGPDGTSRW